MAVTKTENIIGLMNYGLVSRQSTLPENRQSTDTCTKVYEGIADIFAGQQHTIEEIEDFKSHLECVRYLDNHDKYPGIDRVPDYFESLVSEMSNEKVREAVR